MKYQGRIVVILCIVLFSGIALVQLLSNGTNSTSASSSITETTASVKNSRQLTDAEATADYSEAKSLLKKLLSLIYNRYEFGGPYGNKFFMTSNNISPETWDILKFKLATKMLTPNANFLMIFSGSSVTAGHDNYYAQSYPYIFKKRMIDIFKAVGIELLVHDIALGANNCIPYALCYESMGGSDPDFLNWEQSYNCGRDDSVFEATARMVGHGANKGVVYYSASGAWSPSSCPASTDSVPYSSEEWTPATAGLAEWSANEGDVLDMKNMLFKFNSDKPSYARFTNAFRNDYHGIGFMGFNVWEQNNHCKFKNPKNGRDESCNGIDSVEGCSMKFMTQEAAVYGSDNGKGANWHPTRAFHMLRGEAIAWIFGLVLSDTLTMLEQDLKVKSREAALKEYTGFLTELTPALPSPKRCGNLHCEARPRCHTDYRPHYSANQSLSELVVGDNKWDYDAAVLAEWSTHYGYLDAKPQYSGKAAHGEIHFRIAIHHARHFWLCGVNKDSLEHTEVFLDAHVKLDTKTSEGSSASGYSNETCSVGTTHGPAYAPSANRVLLTKVAGAECREYSDIPQGHHVISVRTNADTPDHVSVITHLILWP